MVRLGQTAWDLWDRGGDSLVNRHFSLGVSFIKALRAHKYISREWKGDGWTYTYPDDTKGEHPHKGQEGYAPDEEVTSHVRHKVQDKYSVLRQLLHNNILRDQTKKIDEKLPPQGQKPKAMIVVGPPAAGKSTLIENAPDKNKMVLIDSDVVKEYLHKHGQGDPHIKPKDEANYYHRESADVTRRLLHRVIRKGANLALPVTFSNYDKAREVLSLLKAHGYDLEVHHVKAPLQQVLDQNERRFKKRGRYVPEKIIRDDYGHTVENMKKLKESGWVNNVQEHDHTKPEYK